MVKSYISAIKAVLFNGGIKVQNDQILLTALTQACKQCNDHICIKLPISRDILRLLLNAVDDIFGTDNQQLYLQVLYKAMFSTAYFGLFRIGEITQSPHVLKAIDVHTGVNKKKMMFVLHSSKTHNKGMKPQIIKITSTELRNHKHNNKNMEQYCPFAMLTEFIQLRKKIQR